MRGEGQIRQQLKQVAYRHLQKKLRANFRQRPETCKHNVTVLLDVSQGTVIRMCGIPLPDGSVRNMPCDSRLPGDVPAATCREWEPFQDKAAIKAEFAALIQTEDRGVVAAQYPDIAALLWVLDNPADTPTAEDLEKVSEKDVGGTPQECPGATPGFWGFWKRLGGGGK